MGTENSASGCIFMAKIYLPGLIEYYSKQDNYDQLYEIVKKNYRGKSKSQLNPKIRSIRSKLLTVTILDKFITNHAARTFPLIKNRDGVYCDIYSEYRKVYMSGVSKREFDPYCRSLRKCDMCVGGILNKRTCFVCKGKGKFTDRIILHCPSTRRRISTNIAQMNFMRFAIESGLVNHVKMILRRGQTISSEPLRRKSRHTLLINKRR